MFIAFLNDNDDSPIGKYIGNSFEPVWRNKTTVWRNIWDICLIVE